MEIYEMVEKLFKKIKRDNIKLDIGYNSSKDGYRQEIIGIGTLYDYSSDTYNVTLIKKIGFETITIKYAGVMIGLYEKDSEEWDRINKVFIELQDYYNNKKIEDEKRKVILAIKSMEEFVTDKNNEIQTVIKQRDCLKK